MRNTNYYDGHIVPLPSTLLKTIKKRKYRSENPHLTYRTTLKGLTTLLVALLDEDEISSINELHEYISYASLTLPEDIKNLSKITPNIPNSMESFMEQLKVFANLIYALFAAYFPLFIKLKSVIQSIV